MKSTALFALFLLSAFISYVPSATAQPVLDTNGEMLQNGGTYHLMPAVLGGGGGVEVVATGNESCPLTVAQSPLPFVLGLPVVIESPIRIPYISESYILNLRFLYALTCDTTSFLWTIVPDLPEGSAVKISGYENTVRGWFKIEKLDNGYGLVFCPEYSINCEKVGTSIDESGNRRLVLSENPLRLTFVKSTSSTASA